MNIDFFDVSDEDCDKARNQYEDEKKKSWNYS